MSKRSVSAFSAFLMVCVLALSAAAGSNPKNNSDDAARPSYEAPQPERETLDLNMYQLIRTGGH